MIFVKIENHLPENKKKIHGTDIYSHEKVKTNVKDALTAIIEANTSRTDLQSIFRQSAVSS